MGDFDGVGYLATKGYHGVQANGPEVAYPCFFDCGEDAKSRKRKLYYNTDDDVYTCFVCGASGGSYLLQKHFGDTPERLPLGADPHIRRKILNWAADTAATMLANNDEILLYLLFERGLSFPTIIERRLGVVIPPWSLIGSLPEQFNRSELLGTGLTWNQGNRSGQDYFYNHLLIPYVQRNQVVGIRGRAVGGSHGARYLTGQGDINRLYNVDSLDGATDAIITEGEFDCMALAQHLAGASDERAKRTAVVGLSGVNGFPDGAEAYFASVQRVYIGFDPDDAGQRGAEQLKARFGARARIIELPAGLPKTDWSEFLLPIESDAVDEWRDRHPNAGHNWLDVMALLGNAAGKRVFSFRETGFTYRQQKANMREGIKTGFKELDRAIEPGLLPGQVMIVLAKTGCIQGDAEVAVNRAGKGFKIKLKDLLDRWEGRKYAWDKSRPTYIQREVDGQVRLGRLANVWASGVKTTFTVTTDTGRTIRATDEHPFLTGRGWLRLDELVVGDLLHVRGARSSAGRRKDSVYARRTVPLHPYAGRRNVRDGGHSVGYHRLQAEASLNGLDVDTFIDLCRTGPVDGLRFLDPTDWAVHHVDHDPQNNDPGNLKVLVHAEHAALHAAEGTAANVQVNIALEHVRSIEPYGEEETYDVEVEGDPHNFLANGFVVHNTGKTLFLCNIAWNTRAHKTLFISLEMTREEIYERMRRIALFHEPLWTDDQVEQALSNLLICDENRLAEADVDRLVDEFTLESGERPVLALVDYLGYFARGASGNDQYTKVTNAVMALKGIGKAGRLAVITPAQVNRGAEEGKPIDLDDARDSGAVEETGDYVVTIWRPDAKLTPLDQMQNRPTGRLRMGIPKSRHGNAGVSFGLQCDLVTLAIVDGDSEKAKLAEAHTLEVGLTWDEVRRRDLVPVQNSLRGLGRHEL